jgi:hypothetical protein
MPKKDIDYSKMCIYKIVCNDCNVKDLYIGSTTDITKRRSRHKFNCINPNSKVYSLKIYETIRNNGGWDNWNVVVIEYMHDCLNGEEARTRERQWLELLNANLNLRTPIKVKEPRKRVEYKRSTTYQYPEYYKDCKVSSINEMIEQNERYYLMKMDKHRERAL